MFYSGSLYILINVADFLCINTIFSHWLAYFAISIFHCTTQANQCSAYLNFKTMCLKFFLCLPCMFMPKAVSNIRRGFSPRLPCGAEKVWYLAQSLLNRVKFISGIKPMNTEPKKSYIAFHYILLALRFACVCQYLLTLYLTFCIVSLAHLLTTHAYFPL